MKTLTSIVATAIIMLCATTAKAEGLEDSRGLPCNHDINITIPAEFGPVVPAYTQIDFVIYFKPEYEIVYGGECRTVTHRGYSIAQPTPFTFPDFCHGYPLERIRAVRIIIYFGDGRVSSFYFPYYVGNYTIPVAITPPIIIPY